MSGLLGAAKRRVNPTLERLYRIETGAHVSVADLGYGEGFEDNLGYEPSWWLSVPAILSGLEPPLGPSDVILDLGCGKGRALVQLARHHVAAVLGVDANPGLVDIARHNLETCRLPLHAGRTDVQVADARTYEIPDDVTVVYIANPFRGRVFAGALDQVVASLDRRPRPLRILYVESTEHDRVLATGRFRELPPPSARWLRLAGVDPTRLRRYAATPQDPPGGR